MIHVLCNGSGKSEVNVSIEFDASMLLVLSLISAFFHSSRNSVYIFKFSSICTLYPVDSLAVFCHTSISRSLYHLSMYNRQQIFILTLWEVYEQFTECQDMAHMCVMMFYCFAFLLCQSYGSVVCVLYRDLQTDQYHGRTVQQTCGLKSGISILIPLALNRHNSVSILYGPKFFLSCPLFYIRDLTTLESSCLLLF